MSKSIYRALLATLAVIVIISISFGSVSNVEASKTVTIDSSNIENVEIEQTSVIGHIGMKKRNKKTSQEWSKYKRISDNVKTGNATASITANKVATFSLSVSGGLTKGDVGFTKSISSGRSYTMNVPKKSNKYMAYKARYSVEKGQVCKKFNGISNKCTSGWKNYTIKKPLYGQYALLNAK